MVRSRLPLVAFTALLVGSISLGPSARPLPAAAAAGGIAFQVPSVVDPIHTNGEPDIGLDTQGRVFVSGPTGTGTQRSTWFGSVDGGQTFRPISPGPLLPIPGSSPPNPISSIIDPPGGGDTDISFDRHGKQYFADLYALLCLRTATTSDGGATVQQGLLGCDPLYNGPGADRQWLAVFDPAGATTSPYAGPRPLIYLEYNNLVGPNQNGGAQWNKSTDGITYSNALANQPPVSGSTYTPFGADGYPQIDQQTGWVFQAAGNDNGNGTFSLLLNIGKPDVLGNLTFLDAPDATHPNGNPGNLIHVVDNLPASPDTLFTVASIDTGRNLFVAYALSAPTTSPGQRQVFVSVASPTNSWSTWTAPVRVSDGSTATGDAVNVFPWIKAGGAGRADAVWYGSNMNVDPSSHNRQAWNVFMNQVVFSTDSNGAVTSASPTTTLVRVTPHPMHYDDICLQGTNCIRSTGNRNLADFFEVTVDATGAAEVVYDDTSNGLIQNPIPPSIPQAADHAGAGVITIARQSSGMGLLGKAVSGSLNSPVSGIGDPANDALYPVIGGSNVTGMDIVGSSLNLSPDGKTLNVTMQVVDLAHPTTTALAIAGTTFLQYDTRWQMGNTIYYAGMENTALNQPTFYAGKAQSVDLCSVSACFPHVITYPEQPAAGGKSEMGSVVCPSVPSASTPCTLTVQVKVQDVGGPTASSLLEEVGGYAFAASHEQGTTTNAQAEGDNVPLEIDGACCYNFEASMANGPPPVCREADGNGDIHSTGSGKASFSMDEDHCEDLDTEDIHAQDASAGMNFQSTQTLSAIFNDALNSVVIAGNGTDNGNAVTFTATAVDNGATSLGTFALTLSDGYTNSGNLLDGSILLH
jgi:hypothetical protein